MAQNGKNGRNGSSSTEEVNPAHIVSVADFSPETLRKVIAHLEVSTDFEHLVYREAELDAIWFLSGFYAASEPDSNQRGAVNRLHTVVHEAHDLVADNRPKDAATLLRSLL